MIGQFFRKFPKWAIAALIFFGSTTLFLIWWIGRSGETVADQDPSSPGPAEEVARDGSREEPGEVAPESPRGLIAIDPLTMFLGDDDLYQLDDGEIKLVKEGWLDGEITKGTRAMWLEEEQVLVTNRNQQFTSHDAAGKSLGILTPGDGSRFNGYVTKDLTEAIYLKEGDIWRGGVDWKTAKVIDEKQITNLGYFNGSPFAGKLVAATSNGLLYRDLRTGLIWVNLDTGETDSGNLPADNSTSPDGRLVVGDVHSRPPTLAVFDVNDKSFAQLPLPQNLPRNNSLAWLDNMQAVLALGSTIKIYSHEEGQLSDLYTSSSLKSRLEILAAPSPDGKHLLIADQARGILILNTQTSTTEICPTESATTGIEWLGNNTMLLLVDVPDSEQRGTWFYTAGKPESLQRIFAQPLYRKTAAKREKIPSVVFSTSNRVLIKALGRWSLVGTKSGSLTDLNLNIDQIAGFETITRIEK